MFRILTVCLLCLVLLGAGPSRKEERTFSQLRDAVSEQQHQRVLKLASNLLQQFPGSDYRLDAHRMAGEAAMTLERWREARAHFESYLQLGGREGLQTLQFKIALCLAREGRMDAAPAALRNVAVNDEDPKRSAAAARELMQLRLFEGKHQASLEAAGILLERATFKVDEDLEPCRKATALLSDEDLAQLEKTHPLDAVAGLAGFLLLERQDALLDDPSTDPQRMAFARQHPDHLLLSEVPGAQAWADEDGSGRTIGVLLPLSGRYAAVGELARRGIELAVARSEELGWPTTEIITLDTAGDPDAASVGLSKLAEEHNAVVVLGPLLSAEGELLSQQAEELGVPLMMMVQRPGLAENRANVFNSWVTAEEQIDALVEHAVHRLGLSSFAVAYPAKESSARLATRFWEKVEAAGASIAAIEAYEPAATDFRETAQRIKGTFYMETPPAEADLVLPFLNEHTKPQLVDPQVELAPGVDFQAVFVPDNYKRVSMLAPGFLFEEINLGSHLPAEEYPPVALMGGTALNHPELISRGGKYTEGTLLVDSFFLGSTAPAVKTFADSYRLAWKKDPSIIEANAYDTALLAQQLLSDTEQLSRREFRRRLHIASPIESVTGGRGMRANGEMRHEMLCLTVRKGAIVQAWPLLEEAAVPEPGASASEGTTAAEKSPAEPATEPVAP